MLVQYKYQYKATDGRLVSIKPNESYILISKTNEHWWHVRKDQNTRPFYVPAQYVKQLKSHPGDSPSTNKLVSVESVTITKAVDMADVTQRKAVTHLSAQDPSRETYRFSTFGFCDNIPDIKPCETPKGGETTSSSTPTRVNEKALNSTGGISFTSAPLETGGVQLNSKPCPVSKVSCGQEHSQSSLQCDKAEQPHIFVDNNDDDMDFPSPPNTSIYHTIPELIVTEFDLFPELPPPVASDDISAPQQQVLDQPAQAPPCTDASTLQQVRFHVI